MENHVISCTWSLISTWSCLQVYVLPFWQRFLQVQFISFPQVQYCSASPFNFVSYRGNAAHHLSLKFLSTGAIDLRILEITLKPYAVIRMRIINSLVNWFMSCSCSQASRPDFDSVEIWRREKIGRILLFHHKARAVNVLQVDWLLAVHEVLCEHVGRIAYHAYV